MKFDEVRDFLDHINEHTEQEILENITDINEYLRNIVSWNYRKKNYIEQIFRIANKNKVLYELFKNEKKFFACREKIDFPEKLKFGVEIEVADLPLEEIQDVFESGAVSDIMRILEVPSDTSNKIIQNSDFEKRDEFGKWIFSPEAGTDASEASSPIMENNLEDLNQIVAICTLLKSLNAKLNGGTGLHINVGVDYFECNEKAIENLLKIWGECEELFAKIANKEGETLRIEAFSMALPIKENIQRFFEEDGSVTLNTEEDMESFLYQIQARNRMEDIISWSGIGLEMDLYNAQTDEEIFEVYQRYERFIKNKGDMKSKVRWTSINFNHMKWNEDNPGRIEIRLFNSSLDSQIIFQDLLLVGKIFEVSLENAKDSNYKKDEFDSLFVRDVTEEEKVKNLLNLLFDKKEQKTIFRNRWESVKTQEMYEYYKTGAETFVR